MVCREAGVVGVMEGGWSEAVVESNVGGGGGGGCGEAVVESDVGGGGLVVVVGWWLRRSWLL